MSQQTINRIFIGVVLALLAMVYAISEWGWSFLVNPLLFLFGLAAIAFGIGAGLLRRTDFAETLGSLQQSGAYVGAAAVIYGLFFILSGAMLVAGAVLRQLGAWDSVWAFLKANPGWLLGNAGILLFLASMVGLLGHPGETRNAWTFTASLPRRLLSVIGIVLAGVLIFIGLLEIAYRPGFDALIQLGKSLLPQPPDYDLLLTPPEG